MIKAFKGEWGPFMKKMYEHIARPLYILIAIVLELPEDYFTSRIEWEKRSECWLRFMLHPPRPDEYYEAQRQFGISGHSDQSSLTMLWGQNVAALQMLTRDGQWKWVKPVPGGVTINAGELISHITKVRCRSVLSSASFSFLCFFLPLTSRRAMLRRQSIASTLRQKIRDITIVWA